MKTEPLDENQARAKARMDKIAQLTPHERLAVDAFLAAAKALPRNICIDLDKDDWSHQHLSVSKRISRGMALRVGGLRKRSLIF